MRAMVLERAGQPLRLIELPDPEPGPGQILLAVRACGVCRTDLHILDGELSEPKLPLVPGHQIVGIVAGAGEGAERFTSGERVGVPWLGWTDGKCRYCVGGRENLCDDARFTGYDIDGGYAELVVADERFCFPIPEGYPDDQAAPLLCAGLIGFRALRLVGEAERIGFYGFGASAHILCQVAVDEGRRVFAFTRAGDAAGQEFALSLGAEWAGSSEEAPPEQLDGAIVFAAGSRRASGFAGGVGRVGGTGDGPRRTGRRAGEAPGRRSGPDHDRRRLRSLADRHERPQIPRARDPSKC
jgi:propanol-preferring alcohol dehydrogenase